MLVLALLVILVSTQEEDNYCNNNPSYVYKYAPMHRDTIYLLTSTKYYVDKLHVAKLYPRLHFIFHITEEKTGQQFVICTTPKSGNTRIKALLKKIQNPTTEKIYRSVYRDQHYHPLSWQKAEDVQNIVQNTSIPRFAIVRNPYARALSMYTHKISAGYTPGIKNLGFAKYNKNITFENFVNLLYKKYFEFKLLKNPGILNHHFVPQSMHCGFDIGFTYNYILKQEEINDWFDCFINRVNGRKAAMHFTAPNQCYLSTSKTPCNGPRMENGILLNAEKKAVQHNTGAASMIGQYYSNITIVRMVAEIFQQDFINFNYSFL